MRIRNRSLFPLPPISHSLALLNLPSKSPTLQQLQQKKVATTTPAGAKGEERKGRGVQRLHFKGDHPQHVQPKDEEDDGSTTPDVLVRVVKKQNGCILYGSSLPPNPTQVQRSTSEITPDGKQMKGEEDEVRLTAIRKHNNSKSSATESAAGHALLPFPFSTSSSSPHHGEAGRWFEVFDEASLKKRHCSCKIIDEERKTIIMKEKRNMGKKRMGKKNINGDEDSVKKEQREEEEKYGIDDTDLTKNKGNGNSINSSTGGGSSVMEGSRCSRVNGRGWRCCQQTLVGYALCEHHLGKGRLRSMMSVRGRSSILIRDPESDNNNNNDYSGDDGSSSPFSCKQRDDGDAVEEKMMKMKEKNKNKRKRIGMVKARSISSLLRQPHSADSTTSTTPLTAIALTGNLATASTTV